MALVRAARSSLRRHRGAIGSYASERNIFCEGISPLRHPAPVLENAVTGFNSSYIPSMRMINQLSFGNRGMKFTPQYQFPHAQVQMGEGSDSEHERSRYPSLEATKQGEKPRVVVLGSGWATCRFLKGLDTGCMMTCLYSTRNHIVYCETVGDRGVSHEPYRFKVAYDKLVIASGAEPLTFGIKGVQEHAFFLREVQHAQEIRKKLLMNLMLSETPGISEEEKERLLHCVVIGGGPTGVEFSGELSDFIMRDVRQRYAHVKNYIHVTLIEANEILSSFDVGLREYATKHLTKVGVRLVRGVVKSPGGRVGIDEWLRVPSVEDVFAIGDCAGFLEQTGKPVLPALAQVAERQGKYLVQLFNNIGKQNGGKALSAKDISLGDPFVYRHLGSMATVGRYKALVDLRQSGEKGVSIAGFVSWFIWRSAYLTRVVSWRNRFYGYELGTTLIFGRDNTKI
ncbi:Internal alternative NAD(P)H-ubiquinone oxidoreductase A1, mitochondrial [Datura stramonium]|uniref:NADH:ubiquinone reductase (non-electrogenic) n=1 Tax=Datura stramonium TaxID=4076 RepID=A0ABS8T963_DATST|nr:Internal alternative NAD(P)H-ubiquinone oxidoreductase A1, mitochondrial [Datura stramonium]